MRQTITGMVAVLAAGVISLGGISSNAGDDWPESQPVALPAVGGHSRVRISGDDARGGGFLAVVSVAGRDFETVPVLLRVYPCQQADARPAWEKSVSQIEVQRPVAREVNSEPAVTRPANQRDFHLLARVGDPSSPSNYERRSGRLRAVGERVQVYVDEADVAGVAEETLRDLVATFDETIWPISSRLFGAAADVDGDERLTIFFSHLVGQITSTGEPVDGYVRSADFDVRLNPPLGNQCDLLCLNPRLTAGPHLRTVLAHEYAHGIIFSRRVLDADPPGSGRDEEAWLDEALAHLVEDLYGFSRSNLDHRVRAYLAQPERYSVVIGDYYAKGLFRSHGHRGATYRFLRWCIDRYGWAKLPLLVTSSQSGVENLETVLGSRFEDLFRAWAVEQALGPLSASTGDDASPRWYAIEANGSETRWSAPATSCRYFWIRTADEALSAAEIELIAEPEHDVHLTLIRLPEKLPELRVSVLPAKAQGSSLLLNLSEVRGHPAQIEEISVETIDGSSSRGSRLIVRGEALAEMLPEWNQRVSGGESTTVSISIPVEAETQAIRRVEVRYRDEVGRHLSAWTETSR